MEYETKKLLNKELRKRDGSIVYPFCSDSYLFLAIRLSQHFLKASPEVCLLPFALQLSRDNIMKKNKRRRLERELTLMVAVVISASSFSISLPSLC